MTEYGSVRLYKKFTHRKYVTRAAATNQRSMSRPSAQEGPERERERERVLHPFQPRRADAGCPSSKPANKSSMNTDKLSTLMLSQNSAQPLHTRLGLVIHTEEATKQLTFWYLGGQQAIIHRPSQHFQDPNKTDSSMHVCGNSHCVPDIAHNP